MPHSQQQEAGSLLLDGHRANRLGLLESWSDGELSGASQPKSVCVEPRGSNLLRSILLALPSCCFVLVSHSSALPVLSSLPSLSLQRRQLLRHVTRISNAIHSTLPFASRHWRKQTLHSFSKLRKSAAGSSFVSPNASIHYTTSQCRRPDSWTERTQVLSKPGAVQCCSRPRTSGDCYSSA